MLLEHVGPQLRSAAPAAETVDDAGYRSLTDREQEVFLAMGRGLSNAEIAATLYVGEYTVKTHVGRILAKLGARDRIHAVIFAHRLGLVGR
jgi:DNA-binding NarL/FixJ family response regulator